MSTEEAWRAEAGRAYAGPTCVYRAFDSEGQLLYVGVAGDWARRWVGHGLGRPSMFRATVCLQVTWYDTRTEALAVEGALIKSLRPPHNAVPREKIERPAYGYARFFDGEPLEPAPPGFSRAASTPLVDAAAMLGLEVKSVRNLLSEFRRDFPPAEYRRHPKGYRIRLLSEADLYQLRTILARVAAADGAR